MLDPEGVAGFFDHVPSLKYRAALMLCYSAGLRFAEAAAVKVSDIDSKRMLIRVEQGKGKKDSYVMLSPRLLCVLRRYWRAGGGLSPDHERWISCLPGFFLPVRVLSELFRRLLLEQMEDAFCRKQLRFPGSIEPVEDAFAFDELLRSHADRDWVVYAKPPV